MNRYPRWKYIIILVTLALALLYSVPNFFGEVPAVQISPANSVTQIDQALMAQVEDSLKQGGIAFDGVTSDASGVKVR
ncbi:MAG TPA: protein translocase subunit SecD, partial [Patescibacteria group bacterium]|nr:protein translocase subunit SecD [Patescibacteria group bacterium]